MKNVLASIAAVSVVGGAVANVAQAAPEVQTAPISPETSTHNFTVQADILHVRTGPSTTDKILGHVMQGDAVKVLGEVQGWYQVQYNGQTAYVSKDFVKESAAKPDNDYKVTVSSLRVRTGPSTNHDVIGGLSRGEVVEILGEVQDWYKISYEGQTAYVSKDYVSRTNEDTTPQTLQSVDQNGSYIVDVASLRVRTGAATYYPVTGGVMQGQTLQVTGIENGWYKINRNGKDGYVSAKYVKFVPTTTDYYVTADGLNIRSGAGAAFDVVNTISHGDKVQVTGTENGWFKVTYNGQTGYINKKYVSQTPIEVAKATVKTEVSNTPATQTKTNSTQTVQTKPAVKEQTMAVRDYYVTTSSLNVRSGAGTKFDAIGSVSLGDKVQVTGSENGWFKITYNGQTGYIGQNFVSETKVEASAQAQSPAPAQVQASPAPAKTETAAPAQSQAPAPAPAKAQTPAPAQSQATPSSNVSALLSYAKSLAGTPYVYGGSTPNGFDCSGFIYYVYKHFGFSFGRQSANSYWNSFTKTNNPQPGDFVYFQGTYNTSGASHMGIYLGNGSFISASDNGVSVSSVNNSYWSAHFLGYSKPY